MLKNISQKSSRIISKKQRKEVIKIKAEINKIKNRDTKERINTIKNWFFESLIKIDKYPAKISRKKTEQINNITRW